MFESVELGHKLAKERYNADLPRLRSQLLNAHFELRGKDFPVIVIISGADGAGKGSAIRRVSQALDPRLYRIVGIAAPTDEERAQHYLWRFWRHLPRGRPHHDLRSLMVRSGAGRAVHARGRLELEERL
jgi:polyphosphate kinase 2 (PPK2 family)